MTPRELLIAALAAGSIATSIVVATGKGEIDVDVIGDKAVGLTEVLGADCDDVLATGGEPPGGKGAASAKLNAAIEAGEIETWHAGVAPTGECWVSVRGGALKAEDVAGVVADVGEAKDSAPSKRPTWARDARGCRTHVWAGEDPCAGVDAGGGQ